MKSATLLKVVKIGNSRGVRLPAKVLARYRIGDTVALELRRDGIILKSSEDKRLSWNDTFREMAEHNRRHGNEFKDFNETLADGLDGLDK